MANAADPSIGARDRESLLTLSFALNVAGIYACFMSCSLLHEAIYRARSPSGDHLSPWFVNAVEAFVNVVVAAVGRWLWEGARPVPHADFLSTGSLQVLAKYFSSAARVHGVPGPVQTLVKTARPFPVMLGQRLIAGTLYSPREYAQYMMIVAASVLVAAAGNPLPTDSPSALGAFCLLCSCMCDGYVGGRQKALKASVRTERRKNGVQPEALGPLEMQLFTNSYMLLTALAFAVVFGGLRPGLTHLWEDWSLLEKVLKYAVCSAVGQVFVFTCMTKTDPLVLAMVTSSRKLASVVAILIVFGYEVNSICLLGLVLACLGFGMILSDEVRRQRPRVADCVPRAAVAAKKDPMVVCADPMNTVSPPGNGHRRH